MFTKEVKQYAITEVINGATPQCGAYYSVRPYVRDGGKVSSVQLVIGAAHEDACASYFSKAGIAELIAELQKLHDAMSNYDE